MNSTTYVFNPLTLDFDKKEYISELELKIWIQDFEFYKRERLLHIKFSDEENDIYGHRETYKFKEEIDLNEYKFFNIKNEFIKILHNYKVKYSRTMGTKQKYVTANVEYNPFMEFMDKYFNMDESKYFSKKIEKRLMGDTR